MTAFFLLCVPMQMYWGMAGLAGTELLILVMALVFTKVMGFPFRTLFPVKMPSILPVIGTILIWFSSYLLDMVFILIQYRLFPMKMEELNSGMSNMMTSIPFLLSVFLIAVMPAVCEEAVHRGVIIHTLYPIRRKWLVVVIMGIYFGLFHTDPLRFLPTAVMGAALSYIMLETENMIYYIADMHFGHTNVLRFDNRPFSDTAQMDDTLIQNWNGRVTSEDTVYVLGDAFWKNEENSIRIMQQLQGHKHLIQGNHDRVKGKLRPYWESIEQYAEVNDENRLVILSHYPILFYKNQHYGAVMLYGHVHNTREWELVEKWKKAQWELGIPSRLINVGCMMAYMNDTPRTLDELLEANLQPMIERIRKDGTNAGENSNGEL